MFVCRDLIILRKSLKWVLFPYRVIARDIPEDLGTQNKKAAVDPGAVSSGLFVEIDDAIILNSEGPETAAGWGGGSRALSARVAMNRNGCATLMSATPSP